MAAPAGDGHSYFANNRMTCQESCDYREFRPRSCGTLIADLVDELATVPTIALDLEDWESLCRTIDEYFQVQGVCVTKQSAVGSARVASFEGSKTWGSKTWVSF
jgi:hypothetical protein